MFLIKTNYLNPLRYTDVISFNNTITTNDHSDPLRI